MYKERVTDVFFDLDHTLWDFERNSALTFRKIFSESAVGMDVDAFLKVYIPINLRFWKLFREGRIDQQELRFLRLKTAFDALGHPATDSFVRYVSNEYIAHLSSYNHLFPNTIEILDYLSPKYRLHIVTNGFQEIQDKKLRNSGIARYFDQVINSEMAGAKKPDPLIFRLALSRANAVAERSIMIGDSIEADILGAKAVGLNVLHFNAHDEPKHHHCEMIGDLSEIKFYL